MAEDKAEVEDNNLDEDDGDDKSDHGRSLLALTIAPQPFGSKSLPFCKHITNPWQPIHLHRLRSLKQSLRVSPSRQSPSSATSALGGVAAFNRNQMQLTPHHGPVTLRSQASFKAFMHTPEMFGATSSPLRPCAAPPSCSDAAAGGLGFRCGVRGLCKQRRLTTATLVCGMNLVLVWWDFTTLD